MTIAILRATIAIPEARSLKDKRRVIKSLKDSTVSQMTVSVAEVGQQDVWNRAEQAAAYYDSARVQYEERIKNDPDDYLVSSSNTPHGYLGIAYAGLGRREEAIREGKRAVEIMPLSGHAYSGPYRISNLARIYTMLGEQDAAIDQIEVLLSIPSEISVALLNLDPQWDPLREHPRFKGLVAGG